MRHPLFCYVCIHPSRTRFKAIGKARVYNYMHQRLKGANSSKFSSSAAIESNLAGGNSVNEMLKLFSSAKEMQGIQSHASMEGQGVFAQAVGNQTRIIVFYAGGNGQG